MRHACFLLLGLLVCGAAADSLSDVWRKNVDLTVQNVADTLSKIGEEVQQHYRDAADGYAKVAERLAARRDDVAAALGGSKRRLHTLGGAMQNVQGFMHDMLGANWTDFMPASWASPSFDWSNLGDFDYTSNLADFMDTHDLHNLTSISSIKDLHSSMDTIESAFCKAEAFTPSKKVPASCTGPSVTLAIVPKTCVLESATKQIVCSPAQLVLTKTPGSCTHKYHSASVWVGKACKISGVCGFNESTIIGGGQHNIPLTQIDIGYEFK
ncbi:hypothetical protein ABPG75_001556 [Micractinium tetrahymenae]